MNSFMVFLHIREQNYHCTRYSHEFSTVSVALHPIAIAITLQTASTASDRIQFAVIRSRDSSMRSVNLIGHVITRYHRYIQHDIISLTERARVKLSDRS